MKLVLFDCDGTIVDSASVIETCMARTFVDFGYAEPEGSATRGIIGLTLDIAIARLLARAVDTEIAAMTARYKEHFFRYREEGGKPEPLYAGMDTLIADLSARDDVLLGVVTGKSRRGLEAILAHHDLRHHFLTIRTSDDCPSKPHPAMVLECCSEAGIDAQQTFVIGDAIYDMMMAVSAGACPIGVDWGYASTTDLLASGARHLVSTADDISALI